MIAPVALGNSVSNRARNIVARQCTTDYISNVAVNNIGDGQVLFAVRVEPTLFPTLAKFAGSYQRIRYHSLEFQLSAHLPTNTSGGYIMGFRPDASDNLPINPENRKRFIAGTPGSVKNSIWQSYTLKVPSRELTNRLYYTSPGTDVREFSPGVLYVISDGPINQTGTMSLSVAYDVACSVPSLENDEEPELPEELVSAASMYGYDGDNTWRSADTSGSPEIKWAQVFPNTAKPDRTVRLRSLQYGVKTSEEASQDIQYTDYVLYDNVSDLFYAAIPNAQGGVSSAPLKSPTGNTQVLGAFNVFPVVEGSNPGPTLSGNSFAPRRLVSTRGLLSTSTSGVVSNIPTLLRSLTLSEPLVLPRRPATLP